MKPEMNDLELNRLELLLRQLRPAQAPVAPQSLHQFIATVPAATAPRRRLSLQLTQSLTVRRGALVAAVAAALVVAVVLSSFVVTFRAVQTAGPATSGEWHWQKADGTIVVIGPFKVRNGYIGWCRDAVSYASAVCSSPDGLKWNTPADPRIIEFPGNGPLPPSFVRLGNVYLMGGSYITAMDMQKTELWRSADGVTWARVDSSPFENLSVRSLGVLRGRFVALCWAPDSPAALSSTDGSTWVRMSELPFQPIASLTSTLGTLIPPASSAGGAMVVGSDAGQVWKSGDGVAWESGHLPDGIGYVADVTALSDGGFLGIGIPGDASARKLLRSADGLNWEVEDGKLDGSVVRLAQSSNRLLASVLAGAAPDLANPSSAPADVRVWQSLDGGRSWNPSVGPDGRQMSGVVLSMGDEIGVETVDSEHGTHLSWVGRPGE